MTEGFHNMQKFCCCFLRIVISSKKVFSHCRFLRLFLEEGINVFGEATMKGAARLSYINNPTIAASKTVDTTLLTFRNLILSSREQIFNCARIYSTQV